jgi:SAM-dependent methyltransferase
VGATRSVEAEEGREAGHGSTATRHGWRTGRANTDEAKAGMSTRSIRSVGLKIRTDLRSTKLSDRVTDEAWQYNWMNGLRVRVSGALGLSPGDSVLDVGCGDGWFSLQNGLRYPEVQFTGIDLYEADEAREISRLIGTTNCRFYERDALRMKLAERFDFAVLFMALGNICETARSARRLLANCRRAMKRGARLLIVEPFEEDFPEEVQGKLRRLYSIYKATGRSSGEDRETVMRRSSTLNALKGSGFDVLEVRNRKFGWYMGRGAVMRYFGLEALPFAIPGRFWVFDKPRQVTVILARAG